MKFLIVFLCVFALTLAIPEENEEFVLIPNGEIMFDLSKEFENEEIAVIPEGQIKFDISKEFVKEILEASEGHNAEIMRAVINDYVDKLMLNIDTLFIKQGLDPVSLPNISQPLRTLVKIGEIKLTKGWLQGLSSIKRAGDVAVTYEPNTNKLTLDLLITFNDLSINYDYSAKLMHIGPTGGVEAKITKIQVEVKLDFDFNVYQASLVRFKVPRSGHIDVNFSGHALTDWILNLFIDVTTTIFHRIILFVLDKVIKAPVQDAVAEFNEILNRILNSTTVMQSFNNF